MLKPPLKKNVKKNYCNRNHGCCSKILCQIRSFLGQIANIIKIYFETKSACEMLLEMKIYKNRRFLQQTQQREVNKTDDFTKKHR